jgi:transformation/transcription domain-associated protein
MQLMKKVAEKAAAEKASTSRQNQTTPDPSRRSNDQPMNGIEPASSDSNISQTPGTALSAPEAHLSDRPAGNSVVAPGAPPDSPVSPRQPWEYVDEVLQVLKTSFPLLILSLETMVDQIQHKFKLSPDEDIYRNICMLLGDAVHVCTKSVDLAQVLK